MVLTRLGNKTKMRNKLSANFPKHKMRIELFFGAGGSYFNLPKPKYAILNDLDDDVFNLYKVILDQKLELIEQIRLMPITANLVRYWKKHPEIDPLKKAIRFLLLSNFTYLGKGDTLRIGLENVKKNLIKNIEPTFLMLQDVTLLNEDFRNVIKKVNFSDTLLTREQTLLYLDPIYLETTHFYKVPKWTVNDTEDCFKIMSTEGIPAAMSEFDHEAVLDFASDYKMNVIYLGERRNIKNVRQELLITNYDSKQLSMFN
jgi:DNA adenine methylase